MHLAYFVARYPEPSETFLMRELDELTNQGFHVTVCALRSVSATPHLHREFTSSDTAFYRPSFFSSQALLSLLTGLILQPIRLVLLLKYACSLAARDPRCAFTLLANLHTVAFFSQLLLRRNVEHIHGYFLNLPSVLAVAVSISIGIPCSLAGHARDVFVEPCPLAVCAQHARHVILCHTSAAREVANAIPQHLHYKLKVIHHGIDLSNWQRESAEASNARTEPPALLAVGRLVEKKGFDILVMSCAELRDRGIPFHLLIIGNGPQDKVLHDLVEDLRLAGHVTFAGWCDECELRRLMSSATLLVIPSVIAHDGDRDGIPNVLLEAAAFGIPVIASTLNGLAEFVTDGLTGIATPPGDAHALADAIVKALGDKDLQFRLANNARRLAEEEYNVECNVRSIARLFEEAGNDCATV